MLHYFTHNSISKLAMILNPHWLGNFKSIARDVSSVCLTCQQHNPGKTVKVGHGQDSEPQSSFEYFQCYLPPEIGNKYVLVISWLLILQDALRLFFCWKGRL